MATLASIPEAPSWRSIQSQGQHVTRSVAFCRVRPRSRIVIVSRRKPSRVERHVRYSVTSTEAEATANEEVQPCHSVADAGTRVAKATVLPVPALHRPRAVQVEEGPVSPLNSSPASTVSQTAPSIQLESFPKPPGDAEGWPFPDDTRSVGGTTRPAIDPLAPTSSSKLRTRSIRWKHGKPSRMPNEKPNAAKSGARSTPDISPSKSTQRGNTEAVLLDMADISRPISRSQPQPARHSQGKPSSNSRTSSQREALENFTKELHRYSEKVGATGRLPIFTPTPSTTPPSFRTISALLPYRPEFRAAGLAVTSLDQARGLPARKRKKVKLRAYKEKRSLDDAQRSHVSQVDRKQESPLDQSTIVDFVDSTDIENWRRALIDEIPIVPPRKHFWTTGEKNATSPRCLPCFPGHQGYSPSDASAQVLYDARHHVTKPPPVAPVRSSSKRANVGFQYPGGHTAPNASHALRKTQNISKSADAKPTKRTTQVGNQDEPERPKGLRRRSMTLPHMQASPKSKERKRPHTRRHRRSPEKPTVCKARPGATPFDPDSQASNNVDSHRFTGSGNVIQGRPSHTTSKGPVREPHRFGYSRSLPNIYAQPSAHVLSAAQRPSLWSGRMFKKDAPPLGKVERTAPKFAHHDTGHHATHMPVLGMSMDPEPPSRKVPKSPPPRQSRLHSSASRTISDREALKGLQVVAAAACNHSVHEQVQDNTGIHIRQFLASLAESKSLVLVSPVSTREHRAFERRKDLKRLKQQARKSQNSKPKNYL